jgi:predicted aspartyl protease
MKRLAFDDNYDPPAPVLPVRIAGIDEHDPAAMLRMLVDTGADCTLIPTRVARSLRLPIVDRVEVQGVGGKPRRVPVYAVRLRVGALRTLTRVVALGDEALLGRDVLNQLMLQIDGPAQRISAEPRVKRTRK